MSLEKVGKLHGFISIFYIYATTYVTREMFCSHKMSVVEFQIEVKRSDKKIIS